MAREAMPKTILDAVNPLVSRLDISTKRARTTPGLSCEGQRPENDPAPRY